MRNKKRGVCWYETMPRDDSISDDNVIAMRIQYNSRWGEKDREMFKNMRSRGYTYNEIARAMKRTGRSIRSYAYRRQHESRLKNESRTCLNSHACSYGEGLKVESPFRKMYNIVSQRLPQIFGSFGNREPIAEQATRLTASNDVIVSNARRQHVFISPPRSR
jgi:hypothetical protein